MYVTESVYGPAKMAPVMNKRVCRTTYEKENQYWNIKAFNLTHAFRLGPSRRASLRPFDAASEVPDGASFSLLARGIEAIKN